MPDHDYVTKAVPLHAIDLDANEGVVKGFPAVFGNWDLDNEMVPSGAFAKTIAERAMRIPMGLDHDSPLGVTTKLEEVGQNSLPAAMKAEYPDATGALYAEGRVSMMPENIEWLEAEKRRMARGRQSGMSFTARIIRVKRAATPSGQPGRILTELDLTEWGPTPSLIHRNRAARTLAVKAGTGTRDDVVGDGDDFDLTALLHLAARKADLLDLLRAEKAGKTLSSANATRLVAAMRELMALLQAAGITLDDGAEPAPEPAAKASSADPALRVAEAQLQINRLRAELLGV